MMPQRLTELRIKRVALVGQGADQDANIVLWKGLDTEGSDVTEDETAEEAIEKMAKSLYERVPFGSMSREQAVAAVLDTPEGRELYARHRVERRRYVDD